MATTKPNDPEANLATMHKFIKQVQEKGDLSLIDEIIHPDFYDHSHADSPVQGRDWTRTMLQNVHTAFADVNIEIVHCLATGDTVATHKVLRATHVGELFGKAGTGQRVEIRIMDFVRYEDGKFREHWANVGPMNVV